MNYFASFDIGGTTVKYAVVDSNGQISLRNQFKSIDNATKLIHKMAVIVNEFQQQYPISGIGVSTPGIVQKDGYMVTGGAIHEFSNFPLGQTLHKMTDLPVAVENDGNAAAIAEHWIGNAVQCRNFIMIVLGTGVGGGIFINGDIYRGAHGMAGEFGWNIMHNIDHTHNLDYYSANRYAAVAGGLVARYNRCKLLLDPTASIVTDARDIFNASKSGDRVAQMEVNQFSSNVALLIMNLFANYDPELILIGGGVSANNSVMTQIQQTLTDYLTTHSDLKAIRNTTLGQLRPAKLHNNAGLIGAAHQIKQQLDNGGIIV